MKSPGIKTHCCILGDMGLDNLPLLHLILAIACNSWKTYTADMNVYVSVSLVHMIFHMVPPSFPTLSISDSLHKKNHDEIILVNLLTKKKNYIFILHYKNNENTLR